MWHIVNYVASLPFESANQPAGVALQSRSRGELSYALRLTAAGI